MTKIVKWFYNYNSLSLTVTKHNSETNLNKRIQKINKDKNKIRIGF